MSTIEAPVDVDVLRREIRKTYTDVSIDQRQEFIFPTGRGWAEELGYPEPELSRVPDATVESFAGVANHWTHGRIEPGQVVLDLGSGAGLDVLLSARRVAPDGHAYGVDMTDEMLDIANRNRELAGVPNATLLKGKIDAVPLPDASVDVVISNCVINLAEDKSAVVAEAFRLLKPGGLLAVADMVEVQRLSPELKRRLDSWAGCISGTIAVDEYRSILVGAGFEEPEIEVHSQQTMTGGGTIGSAYIRARKSH